MLIYTEPTALYTEAVLNTQHFLLKSIFEMSLAVLSDVIFAYCLYFSHLYSLVTNKNYENTTFNCDIR